MLVQTVRERWATYTHYRKEIYIHPNRRRISVEGICRNERPMAVYHMGLSLSEVGSTEDCQGISKVRRRT